MRSNFEKLATSALKLLAFFALVSFVLNLLVDNPYTHRLVREKINRLLDEKTEIELEFSAMKVSVVPPGVTLYSLKVTPKIDKKFHWISAAKIKAQVSLWSALMGDFRLSVLESDQLNFVWPMPFGFKGFLKEQASEENLKRNFGTQPPVPAEKANDAPITWPPELDLPVDRIVLVNSNISVDLPIKEEIPQPLEVLYLTARGIDLDINYKAWKKIKGELAVSNLDLAIDSSLIIDDTKVEMDFSSQSASQFLISKLVMQGPRVDYAGGGQVQLNLLGAILSSLDISLNGKLRGDLSILGSYLELADTHGGVFGEAKVDVSLPIESADEAEFSIKGSGKLADAYLDGYRLFDSTTKFEVNYDGLTLEDLHLIIGGKEFGSGRGTLSFNDHMPFEFKVALGGTRVFDLVDSLGIDFKLIDVAVHSPEMVIKGQGDPFFLEASGRGVLSDILLPLTPYDHSRYPVSPHCRADLQIKVNLESLDFQGTQGLCFQPRKNATSPVGEPLGKSDLLAPSGAQHISDFVVQGAIDFEKGLGLHVTSNDFQLPLAEYFAQVPLKGAGPLKVTIEGPFETVKVNIESELSDVEVLDIALGRVRGKTLVTESQLSLQNMRGEHSDGSVIAISNASIEFDEQLTTRLEASLLNVSDRISRSLSKALYSEIPVFASLKKARFALEAPLFKPLAAKGFIEIYSSGVAYGAEKIADELEASVVLDSNRVWAKKIVAYRGALQATLHGSLRRKAHDASATPFLPLVLKNLPEATGELSEPSDDFGLSLYESYDVDFELKQRDDDKKDIENSTTQKPANDEFKGSLQSLPFAGSFLREVGFNGDIQVAAKVSGIRGQGAMGTFRSQIMKFSILGSPLAPLEVQGFVKGDKVELIMSHSGRIVEGRLTFDMSADGIGYNLFVNFDKFDVRFLATPYFYSDPRNYIYVSGSLDLKGRFDDFLRSTGQLKIMDIRMSYARDVGAQTRRILLRQDTPIVLKLNKDKWFFENEKTLFLTGNSLQVRVSMGENSSQDNLLISIDSLLEVSLAREFFQGVDTAEGQLKASLKITGSLLDPKLRFDVSDAPSTPFNAGSWRPVTLGLADMRPAFRNIKLDMTYLDGKLFIPTFRSDKGGGQVVAQGSLALGGEGEDISRLGVTFTNATMIYPVAFLKSFEMQVTGDIAISGSGIPYDVKGSLVINRARSTKEVDIRDEIINTLRQRSLVTAVSENKPLASLDIRITADQTISVNNRNLQSVLSSDLVLAGTDTSPVVRGQINVNKGKFIYKRDFQIVRGGLTFDDPVKPDPSLDIVAVSDVDAYRVFITISGRASNPSVEFSVDPPSRESGAPISKLEILILLSRGKLPSESRSIGGETEKAAASEAANLILGQFEEPVEKLFDLSGQKFLKSFYLDTHPGPEGNPVPRVNVPLDLGENFDIVVRADGNNNEVVAEYNIHNNITFNGSIEQGQTEDEAASEATKSETDAKVNLKFRFSFE